MMLRCKLAKITHGAHSGELGFHSCPPGFKIFGLCTTPCCPGSWNAFFPLYVESSVWCI